MKSFSYAKGTGQIPKNFHVSGFTTPEFIKHVCESSPFLLLRYTFHMLTGKVEIFEMGSTIQDWEGGEYDQKISPIKYLEINHEIYLGC